MEECIHFDILFGGRIFNFVSLHGSPSQSHDVFETFADNLELNWDMVANKNSYLIIILVDFNATSQIGINTTKQHMKALKSILTSQFEIQKLIQEPTNV